MAEVIPWNTRLESEFLRRLGQWHPQQERSRAYLLRQYLQAAQSRHDWDGMKPADVIRIAHEMLAKCVDHEGYQ